MHSGDVVAVPERADFAGDAAAVGAEERSAAANAAVASVRSAAASTVTSVTREAIASPTAFFAERALAPPLLGTAAHSSSAALSQTDAADSGPSVRDESARSIARRNNCNAASSACSYALLRPLHKTRPKQASLLLCTAATTGQGVSAELTAATRLLTRLTLTMKLLPSSLKAMTFVWSYEPTCLRASSSQWCAPVAPSKRQAVRAPAHTNATSNESLACNSSIFKPS